MVVIRLYGKDIAAVCFVKVICLMWMKRSLCMS